jgi:uncharacterized protein with NRDE domain
MCVVALAWRAHPRWLLVLAGNRDELHARPSAPLARWDDHTHIIAGRDLLAGGSWLGVSEQGRVAAITNVRSETGHDPCKASRGALVSDWLIGSGPSAAPTDEQLADYNPFNLFTVTSHEAVCATNAPRAVQKRLHPGIHSLSNGTVHAPWKRRDVIEATLADWLKTDANDLGTLLARLRDNDTLFISDPTYGTRCATVIAVDHEGRGVILEQGFNALATETLVSEFKFNWPY